ERYPLRPFGPKPDGTPEPRLIDSVPGGEPKKFLRALQNGTSDGLQPPERGEHHEDAKALLPEYPLEFAAEGQLEIEFDFPLPHSGTLGSEIGFEKHRVDDAAMGDLKVAVRQERHGWGQRLTEGLPPLTGESLWQWLEACEHEYLVHRLLMSKELTGGN